MPDNNDKNLKQRIIEEMSVDYADTLEKNFDLAKRLMKITTSGTVDVQNKKSLTGKDQILLYLIGKIYAKKAELSETESVGNEELMIELGIKKGSVLLWLKELRDSGKIKTMKESNKAYHTVPLNLIEKILKEIGNKNNKGV